MEELIEIFQNNLQQDLIKMQNSLFDKVMKQFSFFYVSHDSQINNLISQNEETNFIVIDEYINEQEDITDDLFIICVDKNVIIMKVKDLELFLQQFQSNKTIKIHFYKNNIKPKIDNILKQTNFKCSFVFDDNTSIFLYEINSFLSVFKINHQNDKQINLFWKIIKPCLSGYLIKNSYHISNFDRIELNSELFDSKQEKIKFNDDNSIKLRFLKKGTNTNLFLLYHIEIEKLFVIKIFDPKEKEDPDLCQREQKNYEKVHHPFICRCFGTKKDESLDNLVVEYIDGIELTNVNKSNFQYEDKIKIVFQIMLILDYIHKQNLIYRDLKPDNLILNREKIPILIDLDRMIENTTSTSGKVFTNDFGHEYVAPEALTQSFSHQADIYSLGKVISFIFQNELQSSKFSPENKELNKIINDCTQNDPNLRPKLSELMDYFYINFMSKISNQIFETNVIKDQKDIHDLKFLPYWIFISEYSNPHSLFFLGKSYDENGLFPININKAIHYYLLASNQDEPKSLCNLSYIYYCGTHVSKNINKAIDYTIRAAKLNYAPAFHNLGVYYLYVPDIKDINKSISYFQKAADKEEDKAQYQLGLIYSNEKNSAFNIEKAIHYYSLSADHHNAEAQADLGEIYFKGKYIEKNIQKSIKYFTSASKQNLLKAQYYLGLIYLTENDFKDIKMALHYLTLAANAHYPEAFLKIGQIYSTKKLGLYDINKALHYFTIASEYNIVEAQSFCGNYYFQHSELPQSINKAIYFYSLAAENGYYAAQVNLGTMYYEGDLIPRDFKKAIYYYSLAADNNNNEIAQYMLFLIYYEGFGVRKDIEKALRYLYLSAKQNYIRAQFAYGKILYKGYYITRDINKSIYYLKLAADKKHPKAQTYLGIIYSENIYIKRDIDKSIFYFNLAVENNERQALYILGSFYINGQYVQKNIKKGINYLIKSASKNYPQALALLGMFYYYGKYVPLDINYGLRLLLNAASRKNNDALYNLGMIYLFGIGHQKNINKAIYYFNQGCEQYDKLSTFYLGTIYFSNEYINSDINKAIYYYKRASSFNYCYAKNNLAIIYKNGFDIPINLNYAIVLLNEAIAKGKLDISMYNLASIYLYSDDPTINDVNKSISLLKTPSANKFIPAQILLCLALIKKYKNITFSDIQRELKNYVSESSSLPNKLFNYIIKFNLKNPIIFQKEFESYRSIDYVYSYNNIVIRTSYFRSFNRANNTTNINNLTKEFYEGFGLS